MEENDTNRLTTVTDWQGINVEFLKAFKKIYKKQGIDDSSEAIRESLDCDDDTLPTE